MDRVKLVGRAVSSLLTLALLKLAVDGYKTSLHPLYGSVPAGWHLPSVTYPALAASFVLPRQPQRLALLAAGLWLCFMPFVAYHAAAYSGRMYDPVRGPLIVHVSVLAPLLLTTASALSLRTSNRFLDLFATVAVYAALDRMPVLPMHVLPKMVTDNLLICIGGLALTTWALIPSPFTEPEGSKRRLPDIPDSRTLLHRSLGFLLLATAIPRLAWEIQPTLRTPLDEPFVHRKYPVRILSSTNSITGQIVVGETLIPSNDVVNELGPQYMHSLRYLRADHSILGGVWIGDRAAFQGGRSKMPQDRQGTSLGDSIYSAFIVQEATRLVNSTGKAQYDNALIIGLGIGTAASAFQRHGVSTTLVEIDPAVYDAAIEYFGLPDPGPEQVFLEDARTWVSKHKKAVEQKPETAAEKKFDIIAHDCFTGGGVPEHIFTVEFWQDVKAIMSDNGVLAVNFAGYVHSDASRAIHTTLQSIFPQCRVFHDRQEELTPEQLRQEFLNMVIFCTQDSQPLTFRLSKKSDYLNSYLREDVLSNLPRREVPVELIRGDVLADIAEEKSHYILTDAHNPLGKWEEAPALDHWKVMRDVLPDIFWEVY